MLALLALVGAAVATADDNNPPQNHASGKMYPPTSKTARMVGQTAPSPSAPKTPALNTQAYRLTAKLAGTDTTASGHWEGFLVHTTGIVQNGVVRTAPGCNVTGLPNRPVQPQPDMPSPRVRGHRLVCRGFPPFGIPGSGNHWLLVWKLVYTGLSGAPTGTDIRLSSPGAAGALVATICNPCVSGKFGRVDVPADQAQALADGHGFVVVRTAEKPDGEISGPIVRSTSLLKKN
jgi:hypothetical protein